MIEIISNLDSICICNAIEKVASVARTNFAFIITIDDERAQNILATRKHVSYCALESSVSFDLV